MEVGFKLLSVRGHRGRDVRISLGRAFQRVGTCLELQIISIIETFVQQIDKDPLMRWNPKRDSPKLGKSYNPLSTSQGRMTMVVVY